VFSPGEVVLTKNVATGRMKAFAPARVSLEDVSFTADIQPEDGAGFQIEGLPSGAVILLNPLRRRVVTFRTADGFDWRKYTQAKVAVNAGSGKRQIWKTGSGVFSLFEKTSSAVFTYWFSGNAALSFRTAFLQNGRFTPPKTMEAFGTNVIISDREEVAGLAATTGRQ
jgi:hypothetical protein